jgi:hypothetical protein
MAGRILINTVATGSFLLGALAPSWALAQEDFHRDSLATLESRETCPESTYPVADVANGSKIWHPKAGAKWQIILSQVVDLDSCVASKESDTKIFDIDLFDTPKQKIQELHKRNKHVICYFSAGSYEKWRKDADEFKESDMGKPLDGWPGERWLDVSSSNVRKIMKERIQLAASKGCDAIDPDNVDGYQNANGIGLTKADGVNYMKYLAKTAHAHGLAIGLKNAGSMVKDLVTSVQFAVNEQCVKYSECSLFSTFIDHGKPVFHIEYPKGAPEISASQKKKFCGTTGAGRGSQGFSTVLKKMNLNEWVYDCAGSSSGC